MRRVRPRGIMLPTTTSDLAEPLLRSPAPLPVSIKVLESPTACEFGRNTSITSNTLEAVESPTPSQWGRTTSVMTSESCRDFKASKKRKNKEFIGSVKMHHTPSWTAEPPEGYDERMEDDANTQLIIKRIAALVQGHIEEGCAAGMSPAPEDDDFHDSHFVRRRRRWSCSEWGLCCPRRANAAAIKKQQETTAAEVLELLRSLVEAMYFCKQVVVMCAIYIERLLQRSSSLLTHGNWRSILSVSLLTASKVWEDVHPWNADFEEGVGDVTSFRYLPGALYKLEALFLEKLGWRVFVDGAEYASYYFALLDEVLPDGADHTLLVAAAPRRKARARSLLLYNEYVPTIEEENGEEGCESAPARGLSNFSNLRQNEASSSASSLVSLGKSDKDIVEHWKQQVLDSGDAYVLTSSALRECWRLQTHNPYIGHFRHAPPALGPSRHIRSSHDVDWEQNLAERTADVLGPPLGPPAIQHWANSRTLSGATGSQLATEIRRHIGSGSDHQGGHGRGAGKSPTLPPLEEEAGRKPQTSPSVPLRGSAPASTSEPMLLAMFE